MDGRKILVVDDDKLILSLIRGKLQAAGYQVLTAESPSEGVTVARGANPDLFIFDINFPPDPDSRWDGFSIAEWLQHIGVRLAKPVIFITADDTARHQSHASQVGAAAILHKPLDFERLLATVTECLAEAVQSAG